MSIVVLKRKSRKFNKSISGGSGGFSLHGAGKASLTTSGRISKITRKSPTVKQLVAGRSNYKPTYESQDMYINEIAEKAETCVGQESSDGYVKPMESGQHIRTLGCVDSNN